MRRCSRSRHRSMPLGAADLDLLDEQTLLHIGPRLKIRIRETLGELRAEPAEGEPLLFGTPLAGGQQVVRGDAKDPGGEPAVAPKRAEVGDHLHQYLLAGVLRIRRMPEHAHRQTIDIIADGAHEILNCLAISIPRPRYQHFKVRGQGDSPS
jgi:hypothetical protein